jgi:CelD/BcsL family acetyltransferase involved in cellulose biosynthesis
VVFVEDKPLAFWSGERIGDTFYLTWTGFDSCYRKYEIGTILFLKMVEDLLSCGIKEMDYGLGWAQYKERFGDTCLLDQDVVIYAPTLRSFGLNLILTSEDFVNRVGGKLLTMLKVRDKFKKLWRSGLSEKMASMTTNTADTQAGEI